MIRAYRVKPDNNYGNMVWIPSGISKYRLEYNDSDNTIKTFDNPNEYYSTIAFKSMASANDYPSTIFELLGEYNDIEEFEEKFFNEFAQEFI